MTQLPPLPACLVLKQKALSAQPNNPHQQLLLLPDLGANLSKTVGCIIVVLFSVQYHNTKCLACHAKKAILAVLQQVKTCCCNTHTHTHTHTQELHIIQNHHTVPFCDMNVFLLMCVCCMCQGQ
jgi:hypothetical protein